MSQKSVLVERPDLCEKIISIFRQGIEPLPPFMLIGLRDPSNQEKDIYNDTLGYILNGRFFCGTGTTDPGKYYQENPMNPKGTAHLIEGFHKDAFKVGIHAPGKSYEHKAFIQNRPLPVMRYKSMKDYREGKGFLDDSKKLIGLNYHSVIGEPKIYIGKGSAGCQVYPDMKQLEESLKAYSESPLFLKALPVSYLLILNSEVE